MKKIRAKIFLYESDRGGRKSPIQLGAFGCPVFFDDVVGLAEHGYDCRMMATGAHTVASPGDEVFVDLIFLSEEEVVPNLIVGTKFRIWESGFIGEGSVESLD